MKVVRKKAARALQNKSKRPTAKRKAFPYKPFDLQQQFLAFVADNRQHMEQVNVTLRQLCQQVTELKDPFTQQSVLSLHAPIATLKDAMESLRLEINRRPFIAYRR